MALSEELISHYALDSDFADGVGSNDLTKSGSNGAHVAGKLGNCWDNEDDNHLQDTSFTGMETNGPDLELTVDFWFNLQDTANSSTFTILDYKTYGLTNNAGTAAVIWDAFNRKFTFQLYDQSVSTTVSSPTYPSLPTSTWIHVLAWYDSTEFGILVDNANESKLVHNGFPSGTISADRDFSIMGAFGGSSWLDHFMDNVGVWDRKLTQVERDQRYNAGNGLAYPFPTPGKSTVLIL